MKLDKLIKDSKLVERLDKLDSDNASGIKNDGINYWKGKKIVTIAEWEKKVGRSNEAYQKDIEGQRIKEAFQYFPDDYEDSLFPLKVPQELMEVTNEWINRYLELMQFRNNSKCGRRICSNCLLCPDEEKDGNYVGLRRLVAKAIGVSNEKEEEDDNFDTPTTTQSLYPCTVVNRFKCPYDRKEMKKKPTHQQQVNNEEEEEEEEEDSNSYDVDYLFLLGAYCSAVESALIKASKGKSIVPIKNVEEDINNALTDRETLDKLLQQGLDKEQLEYKDEIVEFFMSIKDKIRMEDLTFYKPIDT